MKSIMISIQPQWVEKILNGEKTIEIRKTQPKCELPCKVYIYCTQGKRKLVEVLRKGEIKWFGKDENDRYEENTFITIPHYDYGDTRHNMLGKVVAEFTLNKVDTIDICDPYVFRNKEQEDWMWFKSNACLDAEEMMDYIGYGCDQDGWCMEYDKGYAWHIENLKIYDKPKELSEFGQRCSQASEIHCRDCIHNKNWYDCCKVMVKPLKRPPQSWCYVEELKSE